MYFSEFLQVTAIARVVEAFFSVNCKIFFGTFRTDGMM